MKGTVNAMGMAASQARLLSITARISNNEMEQQSLAYSKQRLSDNSEQINDAYLDALAKTKYQVLTGYNNTEATYADLTYNQLTGCNTVASGKQYLVKDNSGKVLVSSQIANAYQKNNGDFNKLLRDLGYTQADINVKDSAKSEAAIHEAWDRYLSSVGKGINDMDGQHILGFDFTAFSKDSFDGYVTYNTAYTTSRDGQVINLDKDSQGYYKNRYILEARNIENENTGKIETVVGFYNPDKLDKEGKPVWTKVNDVTYNAETGKFSYQPAGAEKPVEYDALYADIDAAGKPVVNEEQKNYLIWQKDDSYIDENGVVYDVTKQSKALNYEGTNASQRELYDYAVALTEAYYNNSVSGSSQTLKYDPEIVTYYRNIFNQMSACGYTTTDNETNFKDPEWFVKQLKSGALTLSYYSTVDKAFVGTTLDSDESITEQEDSAAMVIAEQVYQSQMDKIESQDKQFDLQLNKLESEHNALQTEYESVKNVISKNVEKSFNVFNA